MVHNPLSRHMSFSQWLIFTGSKTSAITKYVCAWSNTEIPESPEMTVLFYGNGHAYVVKACFECYCNLHCVMHTKQKSVKSVIQITSAGSLEG